MLIALHGDFSGVLTAVWNHRGVDGDGQRGGRRSCQAFDNQPVVIGTCPPGESAGIAIDDLVGPARLLLLPDGKILACVYKWGTRNCILTESDDGGVGWSGNRPTSFDPGGPGSLALMADGRLLMQYVYNARPDGHAHMISYYSEGIRVAISKNMGQSWEPQVYILGCWNPDGTGSYLSDSIPLDTDRILSACVLNTDQGMARLQSVTWSPGRESG